MDYTKDFENLCDTLSDQLSDLTRKVKNSGMSSGDLETIDKLTHSLKSVKAILAMMEDDGYSGRYPYMGSYARGRGGNVKRDSMGRYASDPGYSRNDLSDKMRELMDEAPDEHTRREIRHLIDKLDQN